MGIDEPESGFRFLEGDAQRDAQEEVLRLVDERARLLEMAHLAHNLGLRLGVGRQLRA